MLVGTKNRSIQTEKEVASAASFFTCFVEFPYKQQEEVTQLIIFNASAI